MHALVACLLAFALLLAVVLVIGCYYRTSVRHSPLDNDTQPHNNSFNKKSDWNGIYQ